MHENLINKAIKECQYKKLAPAFKPFIQKYNYRNILPPFDQIFKAHIVYTKEKSFQMALEVLKTACILFDFPNKNETVILYKFIIKNCLYHINNEEDTKSLMKIVLDIYKNTKYHVLANLLLRMYFKIQNYDLAYNFLLITSNSRKNKKDFYIYNLYKSLLLLYKEDLEGAKDSINIAYKSKNIRKDAHVVFFIINLINNKSVKTKDKGLIKLKEAVKFGLYTKIYKVIDELKYLLNKFNIESIVKIYCPLLCFANLVQRIFYLKSEDFKLNIEFLKEAVELEYEEVISLICSVIEFNLVKGYISINKNIMVFSRKDPFPLCFTY